MPKHCAIILLNKKSAFILLLNPRQQNRKQDIYILFFLFVINDK